MSIKKQPILHNVDYFNSYLFKILVSINIPETSNI